MGKSKLKELIIGGGNTIITSCDALSNILCNKSSIDATVNSDYTLQSVCIPDRLSLYVVSGRPQFPADLRKLLQLNGENTKIGF